MPEVILPSEGIFTGAGRAIKPINDIPTLPEFDPFGLKPYGQKISDFFSNLGKKPIDVTSPQGKQIQSLTPRPGQLPSGNVLTVGGTVVGASTLGYLTLTNPGVQLTFQQVSGNLANLGQSGAKAFGPLLAGIGDTIKVVGSNPISPYLILGALALGALIILKK